MFPRVVLVGLVLLFASLLLGGSITPGNPIAVWLFFAGFTSGFISIVGGINMRRCPTSLWHSLVTHWWVQYCPICGAHLGDSSAGEEERHVEEQWDEEKAVREEEARER